MNTGVNLNNVLANLLESHGLSISHYNEWVFANNCLPALSATVVVENQLTKGYSLQLDIRVALGSSAVMIESFAGIGDNRDEAVTDAVANFAANSLHPLLTTFYGRVDDQVTVESWDIGAVVWRAIIGGYGIRTSEGIKVAVPEQVFPAIEGLVKRLRLEGTIHWVRTYYGQVNPMEVTCEVLLDNEIWEEAQEQLADLDWPHPEGFYSVRNFLILQREPLGLETTDPLPPSNKALQLPAIPFLVGLLPQLEC